ncbi:MAG: siroheme synthase [candidate division Zixibacteria bacterium HGW-Zixibacteria-1]|nr:MAG: siroheme synthase [candidate division Zixibacteria bacterium HGW-Zixibacteria-1]
MSHNYMPISIAMKNRKCLVVGGGRVALRKIETLINYDGEFTVIAPETEDKIDYYAQRGLIKLEKRAYKSPEAALYGLVISASNDNVVNQTVFDDCRSAGVPVNVVDNPALCDFIFPAVVRRGCLSVSVASDGKAPFLSGHLRFVLENMFVENRWNKIAEFASEFRKKVQEQWPDDTDKKTGCYSRFLDTDWKSVIGEKSDDEIRTMLDEMLKF